MNQNDQIINLKQEIQTQASNITDLDNDLTATKIKVFNLEYDMKEFTSRDSIVIRNLEMPADGDEKQKVIEVLSNLELEGIELEEDIIAVERKGSDSQGGLCETCR